MKKFTSGTEKLIDPITIGSLHFIQYFNDQLPKSVQKKLMDKSAKKTPLMSFIVEPYSSFLCYEIKDIEFFTKLLPKNFELTKVKIFDDDEEEEKYYYIIGSFNAKTSAFFGSRVEAYVIAKNLETDLTSWVIIDYDTNTISYDSKNGLTNPSCTESFVTTDFTGHVLVDMQRTDGSKKLTYKLDIKNFQSKPLDYDLWVEGNLSVAYGKNFSEKGDVFSLKFDPGEMNQAYDIELENLDLMNNNWFREYLHSDPSKLVCFPYAQHYLSDAPGSSIIIENDEEVLNYIKNVDFDSIKVYSTESMKKMIMFTPVVLSTLIVILLLLLIFTDI